MYKWQKFITQNARAYSYRRENPVLIESFIVVIVTPARGLVHDRAISGTKTAAFIPRSRQYSLTLSNQRKRRDDVDVRQYGGADDVHSA